MLEPDDDLDPIDEEHIRQVLKTRGFQIIAERVAATRAAAVQKLLTAPLADVPGLQASIRAYDLVMALPARILEEIKEQKT